MLETNGSEISSVKINGPKFHRSRVRLLKRKPVVVVPGVRMPSDFTRIEIISGIESELRKILTKADACDNGGKIWSDDSNSCKPYFNVTVNKTCKDAMSSVHVPFETIYLPDHRDKKVVPEIIKDGNKLSASHISSQGSINDHSSYSKSVQSNVRNENPKAHVRQYSNNKLKPKNVSSPTESDVKIVSKDHIYSKFSAIESRNSNSKLESEQLRKRLEELKDRRKREQLKIVRLQIRLSELEKQMKEKNKEEIVLPSLRKGREPAGTRSSWLLREKEEYEKLLKDVREIKLKVLRQRHTRELEKIRRLQTQMINLGKKMKSNDQKEVAVFSNLRQTTSSSVCRPEWMKREEEEYDKLLQDVRKIKQSYKLRQLKERCSKSDVTKSILQSEKVLSDKECMLIEKMQKKNRFIKGIENDNRLMHKIEQGINLIDDNEEYGEVIGGINDDCGEIIGVIDEDSIDIDMSKGVPILTFSEELPDPGLLDI